LGQTKPNIDLQDAAKYGVLVGNVRTLVHQDLPGPFESSFEKMSHHNQNARTLKNTLPLFI
jgi:hypothetical protein